MLWGMHGLGLLGEGSGLGRADAPYARYDRVCSKYDMPDRVANIGLHIALLPLLHSSLSCCSNVMRTVALHSRVCDTHLFALDCASRVGLVWAAVAAAAALFPNTLARLRATMSCQLCCGRRETKSERTDRPPVTQQRNPQYITTVVPRLWC